jgi:hypothetical protein
MNLTKRSKWLIAAAALVAGYVILGPKDPDAVQPARADAAAAAHAPRAGAPRPVSASLARSLLALAHRVADETSSGSLFAVHSWYVPPPPPPPAPVVSAPVEPPVPTAPPLPFQYIGSFTPDGQPPVFFLTNGDRVYDVHVGDTLENTYDVDSFSNGQLVLVYKPLNIKQQLNVGVTQ